MRVRVRHAVLAAFLSTFPVLGMAQTPTPQQVQEATQNPAIAAQIQQRIQSSGLTPDQIRVRLAKAGYSPNLLDSFLGDSTARAAAQPGATQQLLDVVTLLVPGATTPQGIAPIAVDTGTQAAAAAVLAPTTTPVLPLFGADVFRGSRTQFQPLLSGPVPSNYRVGPGDVLALVITGEIEIAQSLEVTREGFVLIPQVGQVYVSNLTMDELRGLLRRRLATAYSGINAGRTKFTVTLASLRTNQIYVIGEVVQPGAYQLSSVATVLNALYAAGGPSDRGNFRQIVVRRQGRVVTTFDLYDYLLHGDTEHDVALEQGDVVFVPVKGERVKVVGEVQRPAEYELKDGETLKDLIQDAGGFLATAAANRVSVSRVVPPSQRALGGPDRVVIDVPLGGHPGEEVPQFGMAAGDSVTVFPITADTRAVVELEGAVYHPGTYGHRAGMRLSELIRRAGGFQPAVFTDQATISRLNALDSTRYIIRVPLPVSADSAFPNDIELADYDIVHVYSREAFRGARTITIDGIVNKPGTYPYRNGMTLRDLLLQANGLADGAYLDSAEVASLPVSRSSGALATVRRVPLDSSYLFERDSTTYPGLPGLGSAPRGTAPEIALNPYDHVLILRQPNFEFQRTVTLQGEVTFPGTYALENRNDRLSDIIARAGGPTKAAYVAGARLTRPAGNAGNVNIDLASALRRPRGPQDAQLLPGDTIVIPQVLTTVRVEGGVNSPATVSYSEGAGLDYYIAMAGGYARNADKERTSVRYANGSTRVITHHLLFSFSPKPGPGSIVFVPIAPEPQPFNVTEFMSTLAQILASSVAIVVLVTRK